MANPHDKSYKFKVNDKDFTSEQPTVTGAQIKQIADVAPNYQLYLEVPGAKKEDRLITDGMTVNLAEPGIEKFYTVPAATFGAL